MGRTRINLARASKYFLMSGRSALTGNSGAPWSNDTSGGCCGSPYGRAFLRILSHAFAYGIIFNSSSRAIRRVFGLDHVRESLNTVVAQATDGFVSDTST